jgi:hypothetical protein
VFVFTGTSNQYVGMPLTTYNTVVPEFYIINKSTGTLFIEDAVGFSIATVPSGASCTLTGVSTSTTGASSWNASISGQVGLGQGGQTYTNVTGSRTWYTTYTNTTGRPIFVAIVVNGQAIGAAVTATLVINGVAGPFITPAIDRTDPASIYAVVPIGGTYVLQYTLAQYLTIASWVELR